jgi:hypothetical protein
MDCNVPLPWAKVCTCSSKQHVGTHSVMACVGLLVQAEVMQLKSRDIELQTRSLKFGKVRMQRPRRVCAEGVSRGYWTCLYTSASLQLPPSGR